MIELKKTIAFERKLNKACRDANREAGRNLLIGALKISKKRLKKIK